MTLANVLSEVGYETAISGKWHLGSLPEWGPLKYGFNHSHGSFAGAVGMYDHRYRLSSPKYSRTWHYNDVYMEEEGHATDLCTDQVVKWIDKLQNPYFIYVPFHTVHTPLVESEKWLNLNDHIQDQDRRLMAAALSHLDYSVGRIIEAVKKSGQIENTLFIFFSDNGGIHMTYGGGNYPEPDPALKKGFSSNLPLRGGKVTVYEGGMRVPAFVYWKETLNQYRVSSPVHAIDWISTLSNLVGYKSSEELNWDGRDIWPLITGAQNRYENPRLFYWHWGGDKEDPGRIALREGDWKMVIPDKGIAVELYNLAEDPYEKTDLASDQPDVLTRLQKLLDAELMKDK